MYAGIAVGFLCPTALAQEATISLFPGSEAEREVLLRRGFVVSAQELKQLFEPYVSSSLPRLITVDTAIGGLVSCLRMATQALDVRQEAAMARCLDAALRAATSRPVDLPGWKNARRHLAVGRLLLERGAAKTTARLLLPAELLRECEAIVERITTDGGTIELPGWSSPIAMERVRSTLRERPRPGRGLQAARAWFHVTRLSRMREPETSVARCLLELFESSAEVRAAYEAVEQPYDAVVGPRAPDDVSSIASAPSPRQEWLRLFAGRRAVDTVVVERLITAEGQRLGTRLLDAISEQRADLAGAAAPAALYERILQRLASVRREPEGDIAALFCSSEWQALHDGSRLAGWIGVREALGWSVDESHVLLRGTDESHLVVPFPAFFAAIAEASRDAAATFRRVLTPEPCDLRDAEAALRGYAADLIARQKALPSERAAFPALQHASIRDPRRRLTERKAAEVVLELLDSAARVGDAERTRLRTDLLMLVVTGGSWPPSTLERLANVVDCLAGVARKQLQGEELASGESAMLHGYGEYLAELDGYQGSAHRPRDDAPLVTAVARWSPEHRVGEGDRYFCAGVGRPRAVYAWIERQGARRLYVGAVSTYRELWRDEPPSRASWMDLLRRDPDLGLPDWWRAAAAK